MAKPTRRFGLRAMADLIRSGPGMAAHYAKRENQVPKPKRPTHLDEEPENVD